MKIINTHYWTHGELIRMIYGSDYADWRRRARRILANMGKPHLYWNSTYQGYIEARFIGK